MKLSWFRSLKFKFFALRKAVAAQYQLKFHDSAVTNQSIQLDASPAPLKALFEASLTTFGPVDVTSDNPDMW